MMGDDDDVMKCVWEWNFVRGRVECSQLESISDGMETSMVITHLDGNGFLWGEGGYMSMLGVLCEDWCDVVMPLSFLYNSNFMWWTTNYLYLVPFPTMMSTSSLYTHPLRFRSYSNSMRFIYICSHVESISAMKTLSTLHLQSSSIRRENHQSRFCIYLLWKKKVWKKEMRRSRTREGMRVLLYNRRSDWWRCV